MSRPMLRRALLDLRWTVLWYALGLSLYALLIIQFWPTMRQNAELIERYIQAFPEAVRRAFGITDLTEFGGFIGAEYLNLMWPLIASIFTITAGTAVVASEIDRGTVEFWLSAPVARWRLLLAKLVALLVGIVALAAASVAGIALAALLVGEDLSAPGLAGVVAVCVSFCVAVGGYSALLSALFSERGKAAGLAAAMTIASYLASVIAGISQEWEGLKYLSLMTAFHPQQALQEGAARGDEVGALLLIGVASAAAALLVFEQRDAAP